MQVAQHKWKLFILIASVGFFIDWVTKFWAVRSLTLHEAVPVIGDIVQWQLIYNKGAIFGINPQVWFPSLPVNMILVAFQLVAVVLLIAYYAFMDKKYGTLSYLGMAVIMPGALGNVLDRVVYHGRGVVDFIKVDLNFAPFDPWPIFNVADIYITIGVICVFIDLIHQDLKKKKQGYEPENHEVSKSDSVATDS